MKHPKLPIPPQPKDKGDMLYQWLDQYLAEGDQKEIKEKLNVTKGAVSRVKNGTAASKRIWAALCSKMFERKWQKDQVTKYMQS